MTDSFDVALCQYEFAGVDGVAALTDRAEALLDRAGPADVYVLPELFAVDATAPDGEELPVLPDAAFDRLRAWAGEQARARDGVVVAGSAYLADGDRVVNRCPIATPDGEVRTYDKRRPIPRERERGVAAGTSPTPLVEHRGVTVGALICYDVEFPAVVRDAVDRGAEVVVVPSWTAGEGGYQRVARCCAARAVENQAAVAHVSLVGTHPVDAVSGATGRSTLYAPCDDVMGPHGTRLQLARDEHAAATGSVDVGALRESRRSATVRPYADTEEFE